MASDHRGKPLHAGKRTDDEMHAQQTQRPTPRLVSALGALYGTSTYRDPDTNQARMVTQDTINNYRNARDEQAANPPAPGQLRYNVEGMQKDIRTSLTARDPEYLDALNDHGQSY